MLLIVVTGTLHRLLLPCPIRLFRHVPEVPARHGVLRSLKLVFITTRGGSPKSNTHPCQGRKVTRVYGKYKK